MTVKLTFAPGARVLIRDEEWLVKATLPTVGDGVAVRVVGISELVRNHEALFLSDLDEIEELRPAATKLVTDNSPQYRRTRLYLESLLRRTPPTDGRIHLGHQAAIDYAPYQMLPASLALQALRPRILIADAVGLGKTIEVGILLSELIKRGRGQRILVVAIRSMLAQFQQEIWTRFAIPLVRLDSLGLQRVRTKIPANKNPFYHYDRVIISIDTLKNDAQYRHYLEQCHWDIIVIDECHNVANMGSQRNRLANLLARTCDSMILTSATPHNGRAESFANLINMLEPTAIADVNDYTADDIKGLFTRRFKKDIEAEVSAHFSERQLYPLRIPASPAEEAFFDRLAETHFHTLHRGSGRDALYRIGLLKAFLSSPAACLETIDGRLQRISQRLTKLRASLAGTTTAHTDDEALSDELIDDELINDESSDADDNEEDAAFQLALLDMGDRRRQAITALSEDQVALTALRELVAAITHTRYSKYQRLLTLLRELGADGASAAPRVIIFSERIATLRFLQQQLSAVLHPPPGAIGLFHAGLPDVEQQAIVEDFGKADSPIRILLASDVASEGVNLHYFCHLMIHFDIPWSLITLEQRNGRIDRYGQAESPLIHYLLTVSQNPTLRGDLHILDKLIAKEAEAHKNIGDAATLLGLHDAESEESYIMDALAAGKTPEEILPDTVQEPDWWVTLLDEVAQEPVTEEVRATAFSFYADDLAFARAAFTELQDGNLLDHAPEYHPARPEFTLLAPDDLRSRCLFLPQEALPAGWTFRLTTDRQRVMAAMAAARRQANTWPQEQLFWELHPVMQWLLDKLLICFGRHEAPVIVAPELDPKEFIVLFQGIISNRHSQPLIADWFGLLYDGEYEWARFDLEAVLTYTGLTRGLANPGHPSHHIEKINQLLPEAVKAAYKELERHRRQRADSEGERVREDMRKSRAWLRRVEARIQAQLATASPRQQARLEQERDEVRKLQAHRHKWLDSFSSNPDPFLRVAAIFSGA